MLVAGKNNGPGTNPIVGPGPAHVESTDLTLVGDWQNATAGDELERHALGFMSMQPVFAIVCDGLGKPILLVRGLHALFWIGSTMGNTGWRPFTTSGVIR